MTFSRSSSNSSIIEGVISILGVSTSSTLRGLSFIHKIELRRSFPTESSIVCIFSFCSCSISSNVFSSCWTTLTTSENGKCLSGRYWPSSFANSSPILFLRDSNSELSSSLISLSCLLSTSKSLSKSLMVNSLLSISSIADRESLSLSVCAFIEDGINALERSLPTLLFSNAISSLTLSLSFWAAFFNSSFSFNSSVTVFSSLPIASKIP